MLLIFLLISFCLFYEYFNFCTYGPCFCSVRHFLLFWFWRNWLVRLTHDGSQKHTWFLLSHKCNESVNSVAIVLQYNKLFMWKFVKRFECVKMTNIETRSAVILFVTITEVYNPDHRWGKDNVYSWRWFANLHYKFNCKISYVCELLNIFRKFSKWLPYIKQ